MKKTEEISIHDLYKKYSGDIFRYSFSILKKTEEAEDAVQETFAKHFECSNSFSGECSYKTWLLIIARNYCFNRLKSKNYGNITIDDDLCLPPYERDYDLKITLEEALQKLSAEHNELLYLKEQEGYSYKEIADITHQSLENVKIKLFRTRTILKKILSGDV